MNNPYTLSLDLLEGNLSLSSVPPSLPEKVQKEAKTEELLSSVILPSLSEKLEKEAGTEELYSPESPLLSPPRKKFQFCTGPIGRARKQKMMDEFDAMLSEIDKKADAVKMANIPVTDNESFVELLADLEFDDWELPLA